MSSLNCEIFNEPGAINVPEGEVRVGKLHDLFVSYNFSVCSAMLIRGIDWNSFGLIHIYPGQEIDSLNLGTMSIFFGGSAKIVEGSDVRYKLNLIEKIRSHLTLASVVFEAVDTASDNFRDKKFHTLYKPSMNEIVVARNSHSDYVKLKAF